MKIMVTGGCGFIGSHFIHNILKKKNTEVVNIDCLTYAGDENNVILPQGVDKLRYIFLKMDVCGFDGMKEIIRYHEPDIIINFAASSHVDNSIKDSSPFLQTNILGVANLLNAIRECDKAIHFIHISTDEVYGPMLKGEANENSVYNPQSPYAASKAAADHLVRGFGNTYNIPWTIFHPCNNYGKNQHDEKFIPTVIRNAVRGKPVPVYGKGENVREWIPVYTCCDFIIKTLANDLYYKTINISSGWRVSNLWLVNYIFNYGGFNKKLIRFVEDRKNHDIRYAIKSNHYADKVDTQLITLRLNETIDWYIKKYGKGR